MFTTFVQFLFKLRFPEGQGGMKETFGNSGGEGGFIFLHKNGNSGEVGGLSWNSLRGGGMDIFWNCTLYFHVTLNLVEKKTLTCSFLKERALQPDTCFFLTTCRAYAYMAGLVYKLMAAFEISS